MADDNRNFCSSCDRCACCGDYASDCECCTICGSDYCDCCQGCCRPLDDCTCCTCCGEPCNDDEPRCEDCAECSQCCTCEKEEETDDDYLDNELSAEPWYAKHHNSKAGVYVIEMHEGWMGPQECRHAKNVVHDASACDYHIGGPWNLIHHEDAESKVTFMSKNRDVIWKISAERHNELNSKTKENAR